MLLLRIRKTREKAAIKKGLLCSWSQGFASVVTDVKYLDGVAVHGEQNSIDVRLSANLFRLFFIVSDPSSVSSVFLMP